jgi:hypothetical protein
MTNPDGTAGRGDGWQAPPGGHGQSPAPGSHDWPSVAAADNVYDAGPPP